MEINNVLSCFNWCEKWRVFSSFVYKWVLSKKDRIPQTKSIDGKSKLKSRGTNSSEKRRFSIANRALIWPEEHFYIMSGLCFLCLFIFFGRKKYFVSPESACSFCGKTDESHLHVVRHKNQVSTKDTFT